MTFPTRSILILTVIFSIAGHMSAQTAAPATETTATSTTTATTTAAGATEPQTSYEIRKQFSDLLRDNPSELGTILVLDPTLLSNEAFMNGYPELAQFVTRHPEVRRNPRFYLSGFRVPGENAHIYEEMAQGIGLGALFLSLALAFMWLLRTIIEQNRWSRLSRTQSEVHNKILDRFGTTTELLEYVRSPAGTKFLESAPIPLRVEQPVQNAPLGRIMWSIQLGVVIAAGGLGLLLVSGRFDAEPGKGLFAIGVVAFSVGIGFIASALVSVFLSRRLALSQADESGLVR